MHVRAARRGEAAAMHAVILARDMTDIGRPDYSLQDVVGDLEQPADDLERDVFVIEDDDGALVGWATVDERGARAAVHPDHEGRGAGTLLRGALEAWMRERDIPVRQLVAATNGVAVEHLHAAGYERIYVYERMWVAIDTCPRRSPCRCAASISEAEGPAVHELVEDAFSENEGNVPQSDGKWRADVIPKSEPPFRLAVDDDEGLVAAAIGHRWENGVGYVALLVVALRARGRGHGRAVLLHAFRTAGMTTAELSVTSTNVPAIGLYASVGMTLDFRAERWQLGSPD